MSAVIFANFLIPFFCGFIFLTKIPYYQVHYRDAGFERVVVDSAIYGILWLIGSYTLIEITGFFDKCVFFKDFNKGIEFIIQLTTNISHDLTNKEITYNKYSLFSLLSILVFYSFFKVWKTVSPQSYWPYYFNLLLKKYPDSMDKECLQSYMNHHPIIINLKNRKVYVGIVRGISPYISLEKHEHINSIDILPFHSGIRDEKNLEFEIQNTYASPEKIRKIATAKKMDKELIRGILKTSVTINKAEIVSISPWMPSIYEHFKK